MGADDILKILEKKKELTTVEICELLNVSNSAVTRILRTLLKLEDVTYRELTEEEKKIKYGRKLGLAIRVYKIK